MRFLRRQAEAKRSLEALFAGTACDGSFNIQPSRRGRSLRSGGTVVYQA